MTILCACNAAHENVRNNDKDTLLAKVTYELNTQHYNATIDTVLLLLYAVHSVYMI